MGSWSEVEVMEIDIETAYWAEKNRGTAPTKLKELEHDGVYWYCDMIDPKKWFVPVPNWRGVKNYFGSEDKYTYEEVEDQVEGSCCRYNHPDYKELHYEIKKKTEAVIGRKLYPTYYYDRFYFVGQDLPQHIDRPSCEISVSVTISSNLPDYGEYPFYSFYNSVSGIKRMTTEPGDGIIYKGCEVPHWREGLPSKYKNKKLSQRINKLLKIPDDTYWHQAFFHYVLQDGERAEYAFDQSKF